MLKKVAGLVTPLLVAFAAIQPLQAADLATEAPPTGPIAFEKTHGWKFTADVYAWLPELNTTTAGGDDLDLPLWQILQNLNFTAMAGVGAQNGRFSGFSDFIYMNLQGTRTATANIINRPLEYGVGVAMQGFINTTGAGYSFVQDERNDISAFAGFRYLWLQSDLSFNIGALGGQVDAQGHVFDGIVGLRGESSLTDRIFVKYYGDVGTGQSDFTWQALGGLGYRFDRFDAVVGYRYLDWNFDNKARLDDLTVHGPFAGVRVKF